MNKQKNNILICFVPALLLVLGLGITGYLRGPNGIPDGTALKFLFIFCFITAPVMMVQVLIQILRLKGDG